MSKVFLARPKPPPIAEFDVLFASGSDRPLTHKSQKAASVRRNLPLMPQRRHHQIRKKVFKTRIKFDRPKICSWSRILRFLQRAQDLLLCR
ncbi:hypothetical protein [Microcoleus sp. B4-C1]|uniref:hypothetical protein n=1 Tax=Microcoleus sp. B4-C1 TaxID=2818660 RepID=UPI002FD4F2B5